MAEVGLVRFAQVALDVAKVTVPRYRTCFSKRQFSQPQLLAILCLMRYEDWTFREAEVRLSDTVNCGARSDWIRSPTTLRFIASCDASTKLLWTVLCRKSCTASWGDGAGERPSPSMPPGLPKARSARFLSAACITTLNNHCPGDTG